MASVLVVSATGLSNAVDVSACAAAGFAVRQERLGPAALAAAQEPSTVAIVVDADGRGLVPGAALAFCRQVRTCTQRWLILLVPRLDEAGEMMAWSIGVNDYVSRGAGPRALVARLAARVGVEEPDGDGAKRSHLGRQNAIQRQRQRRPQMQSVLGGERPSFMERSERLSFENIQLDGPSRMVYVSGSPVHLTRTEFDLLAMLLAQPQRVFSRAELIGAVWGETWFGDDHFVETHASRLRRKISAAGGPRIATAVRGVGYRLVDGVNVPPWIETHGRKEETLEDRHQVPALQSSGTT